MCNVDHQINDIVYANAPRSSLKFFLSDIEEAVEASLREDDVTNPSPPLVLLLKQNKGIPLGPHSCLEVAITYAPCHTGRADANCSIVITKQDHSPWLYTCTDEKGCVL